MVPYCLKLRQRESEPVPFVGSFEMVQKSVAQASQQPAAASAWRTFSAFQLVLRADPTVAVAA